MPTSRIGSLWCTTRAPVMTPSVPSPTTVTIGFPE
jgi:hypothetical protein